MKTPVIIQFKSIHPQAKLPVAAHKGDIGFDLCSVEEHVISGIGIVKIKTGIQLANVWYQQDGKIFKELELQLEDPLPLIKIEGRSSLAAKGIFPVGGIIDTASYRGEIMVVLASLGANLHKINIGDKIAQLVVYDVFTENAYMSFTETVSESKRGTGGFGSTDHK